MNTEHRRMKRRLYSKQRQKERKLLGFKNNIIPTGDVRIEGFEKHHILKTSTIFLPSFVHREIPHGFDIINSGMEEVNEIALNYLLGNW